MERQAPTCEDCGEGHVATVTGSFEAAFREGTYTVEDAEFQRCDSCQRVFFTRDQLGSLQRKAASLAREEQGLLTPDEIKDFRLQHDLTQTDLEAILGVSPKSVTRWEKGTVFQNAVVDKFLRVLVDNPDLIERLLMVKEDEGTATRPRHAAAV